MGGPGINGAQAEYLRVPLGETTLLPLPADTPPELVLLMTDILPTGYSIAMNARRLADEDRDRAQREKRGICVVLGCGPVSRNASLGLDVTEDRQVGLCAITSAATMFSKVFATDLQVSRLASATKHGAIALPANQLKLAVYGETSGRGADAVLEVVGHPSALTTAIDLVRPYGVISSGGLHKQSFTLEGSTLYDKK